MKTTQKMFPKAPLYFLLLILWCVNYSCSSSAYYAPLMQGKLLVYQPKPMQSDSIKSNGYLHAVYGFSAENETNDGAQFLGFSYSRAHVLKKTDLSYSFFGALGAYRNGELTPDDPNYFTYKKFSLWGMSTSANLVSVSGRTEFRFPGVELAISKEFGKYVDFRKQMYATPGVYVNTNTLLTSIAGTAEIIWHHKKRINHQYGIRMLLGRTLGNRKVYGFDDTSMDKLTKNMMLYIHYFLKFNRLALTFEQSLFSGKMGFIYSFK